MINDVMRFDCNECGGVGLLFWGDSLDYSIEKCECENFALGTLFTSGEAD
jgi:hypothetical protein